MVHDGLGVREEAVKAPVEDAGGDEGVDIADVETARVDVISVNSDQVAFDVGERQALCEQVACGEREGKGKGSQMLTTRGDAGRLHARHNDVVDEAGEGGDGADKEGGDGAPVGGVSRRVAVDAVEVVHIGYGHVTTSDDVVAAANGLVDVNLVGGRCVRFWGTNSVMRMDVMGPRKMV